MNINPIRVLTTSDRKPPLLPNTEDLHAEKDAEDGLSDEATPSRSGKGGSNSLGNGAPGVGGLPGDIVHHGQRTTFYFPLVSCIVISVLLSLILWIINQFRR